jgi:hypothetical protein
MRANDRFLKSAGTAMTRFSDRVNVWESSSNGKIHRSGVKGEFPLKVIKFLQHGCDQIRCIPVPLKRLNIPKLRKCLSDHFQYIINARIGWTEQFTGLPAVSVMHSDNFRFRRPPHLGKSGSSASAISRFLYAIRRASGKVQDTESLVVDFIDSVNFGAFDFSMLPWVEFGFEVEFSALASSEAFEISSDKMEVLYLEGVKFENGWDTWVRKGFTFASGKEGVTKGG